MTTIIILINNNEVGLIPYGYCACGCRNKTSIHTHTRNSLGIKKGDYRKFCIGHQSKGRITKRRKIEIINSSGYVLVFSPLHPNRDKDGRVRKHILIAEKVLGKHLPPGVVVHHTDSIQNNHAIVICQNETYHKLIEQRTRAYRACGNAKWRKCKRCKKYGDPAKMSYDKHRNSYSHTECNNKYERERRLNKRIVGGEFCLY
jgi:hypothetical protein